MFSRAPLAPETGTRRKQLALAVVALAALAAAILIALLLLPAYLD